MVSDKRISELVELTSLAADDELPVVDADANATKRITGANMANFAAQPTFNGNDVYHQGNILGTVSESGGTPTGAVIERGSNANGEYVKYADGTVICIMSNTVDLTGFFLTSFAFPPVSMTTGLDSGGHFFTFSGSISGSNVNACADVVLRSGADGAYTLTKSSSRNGSDSSRDVKVVAVGRWF